MRLHVSNFRCWDDKVITFSNQNLILLSGKSESGKSTLFDAISWCLYGGMKDITPWSDINKQTRTIVSLTIKEKRPNPFASQSNNNKFIIRITRKSNSKEFIVTIDKHMKFYQEEAESIITQLYASKQIWSYICYIPQEDKKTFLYSNSAQKMNYLNALTFDLDELTPTGSRVIINEKIEKCSNKLKVIRKLIKTQKSQIQVNRISSTDIELYYIPPKKRDISLQAIKDLTHKKNHLIRQIANNDMISSRKKDLNQRIRKLKLDDTNIDLNIYRKRRNYLSKFNKQLYAKLETLKIDVDIDLVLLGKNEVKIKKYLEICAELNIEYNKFIIEEYKSSISQKIIKLKSQINNNIDSEIHQRRRKILNKFDNQILNNIDIQQDLHSQSKEILIHKLSQAQIYYEICNKYNIECNYNDILKRKQIISEEIKFIDINICNKRYKYLKWYDPIIFGQLNVLGIDMTIEETRDYELKLNESQQICSQYFIEYNDVIIREQLSSLKSKIGDYINDVVDLEIYNKRRRLLKKYREDILINEEIGKCLEKIGYNNLQKNLDQINKIRSICNKYQLPYNEQYIMQRSNELFLQINKLSAYDQINNVSYQKRRKILKKYDPTIINKYKTTCLDLQQAQKMEELLEISRKYGVEYNEQAITQRKQMIDIIIKKLQLQNKLEKYINYSVEPILPMNHAETTQSAIDSFKHEVRDLYKNLKGMKCPVCESLLERKDEELILLNSIPKEVIKQEIKLKKNKIRELSNELPTLTNKYNGELLKYNKDKSLFKKYVKISNQLKDINDYTATKSLNDYIQEQNELIYMIPLQYTLADVVQYNKQKKYQKYLKDTEDMNILDDIINVEEFLYEVRIQLGEYRNEYNVINTIGEFVVEVNYTKEDVDIYIKQQKYEKYLQDTKHMQKYDDVNDLDLLVDLKKKYSDLQKVQILESKKYTLKDVEKFVEQKKYHDYLYDTVNMSKYDDIEIGQYISNLQKEYNDLNIIGEFEKVSYTYDMLIKFIKHNKYKKILDETIHMKQYDYIEDLTTLINENNENKQLFEKYEIIYHQVKDIEYLDRYPYKSCDVAVYIKHKKYNDYLNMTKPMEKYDEIENLEKKVNDYKQLVVELKELPVIINISDNEISEIDQKIELLNHSLRMSPSIDNYLNIKKKYEKLKHKLEDLSKKHTLLLSIRNKIDISENICLHNTVNVINKTLNRILFCLFAKPISVELSLIKQLSSGKHKRQVNFKITYRGHELHSIAGLSGGARSRFNIAFILAQSVFCKFPYIMLDEVISSVESELAEECLKILKKYSNKMGGLNKSIINVSHTFIDGFYDEVINI